MYRLEWPDCTSGLWSCRKMFGLPVPSFKCYNGRAKPGCASCTCQRVCSGVFQSPIWFWQGKVWPHRPRGSHNSNTFWHNSHIINSDIKMVVGGKWMIKTGWRFRHISFSVRIMWVCLWLYGFTWIDEFIYKIK